MPYRALLKMWLLPPLLNIGLIVLGLILIRRWRRLGTSLILLGSVSLYLFSTPWFADHLRQSIETYPAISTEQHATLKRQTEEQATAIVMLGSSHKESAAEYEGTSLDASAIKRINYAVWLAKQIGAPVLASGGAWAEGDTPHAKAVADYAKKHLNFELRWQENRARTTYENALYSKTMLAKDNINQVILVTQSYHMRRSVELFEAQGFEVIAAPTDLANPLPFADIRNWIPGVKAYSDSYRAMHEQMGWAWYKLVGFD